MPYLSLKNFGGELPAKVECCKLMLNTEQKRIER